MRTTVASEIAGMVVELSAEAGDFVKAGQVICRLRDDVRRFAHQEAEAAKERFEKALDEWRAMVERAAFEKARLAELRDEGQGTEREYLFAKTDHDAAVAKLAQGESELRGRQAVVSMLADNLARAEIRAPFDGYVVSKRTEVGSWIIEGGPVVDMVALDVARVRVPVPESAAAYCRPGMQAIVLIDALNRGFEGRIGRIIPDADPKARTFPIEIDVANPETTLKAGMFARADVPSGPSGPRLVVPKDAIVRRGPTSQIFVVRPEGEGLPKAVPMPVEVDTEILDDVTVKADGLKAGDLVVVRGNELMFGPTPVMVTLRKKTTTQPGPSAEAPPGEQISKSQ